MGKVHGPAVELELRAAWLAELDLAAVTTDLAGVICGWNDAAGELYGRDEAEMLGSSATSVVLAPADEAIVAPIVRGLLELGRWRGELEVRDAIGLPLRLDVRARAVHDSAGEAVGFEALFVDLSKRVEAQQRASELDSRLALAHRIASLGSWLWDAVEDRLIASDSFTDLLGLESGAELTMADVLRATTPEDRTVVQSALDELRFGGSEAFAVKYRVRGADGGLRWLEAHCGAVRDGDGVLIRVWGTTQDVTERIRARDRLQQAGELWQGTLDSLSAHIAVLDGKGEIVAVNAAWRRFAESEDDGTDYVGSNYIAACEAAADPLATEVAVALRELTAGEREIYEIEYPCDSPSEQRWFVLRATRYEGSGPLRVVVAHENVTARHAAQQQVVLQAELLDEIDVSVIVTDPDLRVVSWNAGAERLYGWSAQEAVGNHVSETVGSSDDFSPADEEQARRSIAALHRDGRSDGEYVVCRKDGSTFQAHVRSRLLADVDGRETGVVNVAMDVTERKNAERALLSARSYLAAVTDSIGEGVLAIDSDRRGTYMNQAAQEMLGWSFEELRGRELHSVLHNQKLDGSVLTTAECPMLAASRDGQVVRVEDDVFIRRDGTRVPVAYTASPFVTKHGIDGCVVVFEDITERKAAAQRVERDLDKLAWLQRIKDALTEERFVLHAQPIIDLRTGEAVQRELLIRMHDTDDESGASGKLISPGLFLPVAEEYGLITEIDRWVIDRSTELAAATGKPVQINVSARSVSDPLLVDYIKHAIERAGADPATIVFEITETILISDAAAARAFVERLHQLGCKIALDDFGTGYGGFTYLKQLPIDFLKIDIEFVRDLRDSSASRHVVEAVVNLAARFGMKTVGEGVEDQETLDLLIELGVDYAQGFHLGGPAPL